MICLLTINHTQSNKFKLKTVEIIYKLKLVSISYTIEIIEFIVIEKVNFISLSIFFFLCMNEVSLLTPTIDI